jgi:hypothetical protein
MTRQHHRLKARLFGEGIDNGNIVIAMIIPRSPPLHLCGQGCLAMAALINRQNPKRLGQGPQHRAIGQGIKAIGMEEDQIDGPGWVTKVEGRH